MSGLCCHQGVPIFKILPHKPSYHFGIMYNEKRRQCRGWAPKYVCESVVDGTICRAIKHNILSS